MRVRFCNRTPKDGKSGETLDAFEKNMLNIKPIDKKKFIGSPHSENAIMNHPHHLRETTHPMLLVNIDSKRCKPWPYHNRDNAWLTRALCGSNPLHTTRGSTGSYFS